MPRDKSERRKRIVSAAKAEFLSYGFENASLRRIASNADITVSGLYKHFSSKEDMFAGLIQPMLDDLNDVCQQKDREALAAIEKIGAASTFLDEDAVSAMDFIYDHFDEVKLLVCHSQGTKYEDYVHMLAEMEERRSLLRIEALRQGGYSVPAFDRREFHLLVSSHVEAFLQPVRHDFTREEARHYATTLNIFFSKGWKWLCGIEEPES